MMLDGAMLLWFPLTALSLLYVAIDIRTSPESTVLKWGFILITAYMGPLGAFLYVLGCREPLPGLHERYVATRWRQVLGSTMHCVAGDGIGILAGAVVASILDFSPALDIGLEYVLGFGFGWAIFQALFMRDMAGGSYARALSSTFFPELLSMNCLMAGMVPVMTGAMKSVPSAHEPIGPAFWFVMSMALAVGFITSYPMNWWLVSKHLKHGMMTIQPSNELKKESAMQPDASGHSHNAHDASAGIGGNPTQEPVSGLALARMAIFSFIAFGVGLVIAALLTGL